MLSVLICEDDAQQRINIEKITNNHITAKNYAMEIALSTSDPTALLNHVEKNQNSSAIYLLDVNLKHEINGIALASALRKIDVNGIIIFITTHLELSFLTFEHKVEAMDYIAKTSFEGIAKKIKECLDVAYTRYLNHSSKTAYYQVKAGDKIRKIPLDDIMFFESHHISHKLILHTTNGLLEFYGSLSEAAQISTHFYRCHQSFVVNTKNIKCVDKTSRNVEMVNGEALFVTAKKVKKLIDAMTDLHG